MTTYNGIGTLHYDWERNDDNTANATEWFVVFFLPVAPIRRKRLRVIPTAPRKSSVLEVLFALFGSGSGFETRFEFLESVPNSFWRILRTYLMAYLGIPIVTLILPTVIFVFLGMLLRLMGLDESKVIPVIFPIYIVCFFIWFAVILGITMDRAAGRHHVDKDYR